MSAPAINSSVKHGSSALALFLSGLAVVAIFALDVLLRPARLPFDDKFWALVDLGWAGFEGYSLLPMALLEGVRVVGLTAAIGLMFGGLLPAASPMYRAARAAQPYVVIAPALYLSGTSLGRGVANLIYAGERQEFVNLTPLIYAIEGNLAAEIQLRIASPATIWFAGMIYSVVWLTMLVAAPLVMGMRRDPRGAWSVILAPAAACLLAVPIFVLFPVNDPWSLNPAYGFQGPHQTSAQFLLNVDKDLLDLVATRYRRIVGSGLPSLHVVLPALIALQFYSRGHRKAGHAMAMLTVATVASVVMLARHWLFDCVVAVGFAYAVHWLLFGRQHRRESIDSTVG